MRAVISVCPQSYMNSAKLTASVTVYVGNSSLTHLSRPDGVYIKDICVPAAHLRWSSARPRENHSELFLSYILLLLCTLHLHSMSISTHDQLSSSKPFVSCPDAFHFLKHFQMAVIIERKNTIFFSLKSLRLKL